MSNFSGRKTIETDVWLKLDNAAKIFPSGTNNRRTLVFRLTAEITQPVRYSILQEAVRLTALRYPYFTMHLRRGFFWYWLDSENPELRIVPDRETPCRGFPYKGKEKPLCRILTRGNQISAEFYHVLTDGYGGMEFLKTLLAAYGELSGLAMPESGFSHYTDTPREDETEDAYNRYFDPRLPAPPQLSKAYHIPFPVLLNDLRILSIEIDIPRIKEQAGAFGITLTEYLTSVYLWSLQDVFSRTQVLPRLARHPVIRIQVPVNLRKIFPTRSLRNFSLFVTPEIDMRLGPYTFEEITRTVHHYMLYQTDPKLMRKRIYKNVRNEKNLLIRIIPLVIKNWVLSYYFQRSGVSLYSGLITNLGRIELSGDLATLIARMRFLPPPPSESKASIGVVTCNDRMVLSFSNSTGSNLLETIFIQYLMQNGIPVRCLKP